jgi:hypothetical protein
VTVVSLGAVLLWRDWDTFTAPVTPNLEGVKAEHREKAIVFQIIFGSLFFPVVIFFRAISSRGARLVFVGWAALSGGAAALLLGWPFLVTGESSPLRFFFGGRHGLLVAIVAAVPLGALLHVAKTHQRFIYGAFEYLIGAAGFVLGVVSLGATSSATLAATLATAAGSYLMVEGIQSLKGGWPEIRELAASLKVNG